MNEFYKTLIKLNFFIVAYCGMVFIKDSGSVGLAFESLRVHQYLQWFQAFLSIPYKFYIVLITHYLWCKPNL